ncbi:MAG: HAD family phosphatase [Christensenellaceae bacterium]|jgi:16S rRNA pseudouridine516 synthase|nr:HAD family phosphatase [Christensenellaceae bacterium]
MKIDTPPIVYDYSAFLLDWDGTPVDSMPIWNELYTGYIRSKGRVPHENFQQEKDDILHSLAKADNVFARLYDELHRIYDIKGISGEEALAESTLVSEEKLRTLQYKPNAAKFLRDVKALGMKMAVVTTGDNASFDAIRRGNFKMRAEADFDQIFEGRIITSDICKSLGIQGKPSGDPYRYGARLLNIAPKDCLVFEDSMNGAKAGWDAGMDMCIVRDSYSDKDREEMKYIAKHVPTKTYFIEDLGEVRY